MAPGLPGVPAGPVYPRAPDDPVAPDNPIDPVAPEAPGNPGGPWYRTPPSDLEAKGMNMDEQYSSKVYAVGIFGIVVGRCVMMVSPRSQSYTT